MRLNYLSPEWSEKVQTPWRGEGTETSLLVATSRLDMLLASQHLVKPILTVSQQLLRHIKFMRTYLPKVRNMRNATYTATQKPCS